jgi:serine/threonine-protein kinase
VARRADPDPTGWRDRARDPNLGTDRAALAEVIKAAPVADQSVPLLLALSFQLPDKERLRYLQRIQQAHPGDFWANLALGEILAGRENNKAETIRYYQAAVAIRPKSAFGYSKLGLALYETGRLEEAAGQFQHAVDHDPTSFFSQCYLALILQRLGRHDQAIDRLRAAVRASPKTARLRAVLGNALSGQGRYAEGLAECRQALALDPKDVSAQGCLRFALVRMGRMEEARLARKEALEANSYPYDDWCGYAEFCLYLGLEKEYRNSRQALLRRFGSTTNPYVAARLALACLLLPATGDELRQAVDLAERAAAAERSKYPEAYPHFLYAQGLAEYRQGQFDRAVCTMRGDGGHVRRPDARLVLAMALYQSGQAEEARKTLAEAVPPPEVTTLEAWSTKDWGSHVLRREAEALILPGHAGRGGRASDQRASRKSPELFNRERVQRRDQLRNGLGQADVSLCRFLDFTLAE